MPHYSHYAWLNINFTKVHKELNIFYHSRELIYYGSIVSLSIPENSITYILLFCAIVVKKTLNATVASSQKRLIALITSIIIISVHHGIYFV